MSEFQVWAPLAHGVDLHLQGDVLPMRDVGGGWWRLRADQARAGWRYGYSLDGGPVRPDPRSGSQPQGIDGLSELVDHGSFEWHDRHWRGVPLPGSVFYELHVGTFTPGGTFASAIERIPHLVELGVDAVELMPVAEFSGDRGWGYDGVDLFAPHHGYGGPSGLKRLIDALHANGLAAVIDVVYNHLGPAGNYLGEFGPYFSEHHQTNWGPAVNLDGPDSHEVRRFVIDNALMWLRDFHADGLRLDAVHAIVDDSAVHILEELAQEVRALATHLGRPLFVVAESDRNDPRFVRSRDAGGMGLDACWADEWHHALHAALTGERDGYYSDFGSLESLAKALGQAWVYDGSWSPHRRRRHGRSPGALEGHRFVVFIQNHDQIGNRAAGERLAALVGPARARVAAALLLTSAFVPLIFQGEEWGASSPFQYFTDHRDEALGKAVSDGRRSEFAHFGWDPSDVPDPQDPATFERSRLDWSELAGRHQTELLDWYRKLISLRRRRPELSDPRPGSTSVEVHAAHQTLVVGRGAVRILVNLGSERRRFGLPGPVTLLAASDPATVTGADEVVLPPDAAAVVEVAGA